MSAIVTKSVPATLTLPSPLSASAGMGEPTNAVASLTDHTG